MSEYNKTANGKKYSKLAILGLILVLGNNIGIGFLSIYGYGGDIKKLILYFVTHFFSAAGAVLVGIYTGGLVQYNTKKRIDVEE
mgnify:CR=1 FL=1